MTPRPRACVFVGPSLRHSEIIAALGPARELVRILPPVGRGDVLALLHDSPEFIGIIDGYFFQRPSVQHKEILLAIERGIQVMGAASMGALRAAELDRFGMEGIGDIYRLYARGRIDGDDEVAVVHGTADDDYRPLTEPLVNVREAARRARMRGLISVRTERAIILAGKRLDFTQRRYGIILRNVCPDAADEVADFERFVREEPSDLKRNDARRLLQELSSRLVNDAPRPARARFETSHTVFLAVALRERKLAIAGHDQLTEALVLSLQKLLSPAFPALMQRIAWRMLAADEALFRGVRVPSSPSLIRQWRARHRLSRSADFANWLAARGLDNRDVERWLTQRQLALAMINTVADGRASQRLDTVLRAALMRHGMPGRQAPDLVQLPMCPPGVPWEAPLVRELKMLGQWSTAIALAQEVVAIRDEVERKTTGLIAALAPSRLEAWFARRWNIPEAALRSELLNRGFTSYREFIDVARTTYMADRHWAM